MNVPSNCIARIAHLSVRAQFVRPFFRPLNSFEKKSSLVCPTLQSLLRSISVLVIVGLQQNSSARYLLLTRALDAPLRNVPLASREISEDFPLFNLVFNGGHYVCPLLTGERLKNAACVRARA